jgi:hypothetical protein
MFLAVATGACSAPARAPDPPRVLVDALLVEIANADLGLLGEASFAEIAASPKVAVLAHPSILAADHEPATISIRGASGDEERWTVKADVVARDELGLDVGVATGRGADPFHVALVTRDGQRTIVGTNLPARDRCSIVALLRPDIVRSDADLRRIYERKMRERARTIAGLSSRPEGIERR